MLEVVYISNADRSRLIELQNQSPTSMDEHLIIQKEIDEINTRKKPLHECTIDECTELRTTIYEKFDKLNRSGKFSMAQQFKMMLQRIELRQAEIYREMSLKEAKRKAEKLAKKDKVVTDEEQSKAKTNPQSGSSRWTTGIANLD